MSNPFDLLGNDVEDPNQVVLPPKEIVKKNNLSSKKADVPPASANPAKARNNRPRPTGNEGAMKDRSAGRRNNKSKDVSASSTAKRDNSRKQSDRHSRTGKTDSGKKVRQGWGDDNKELETEVAADADADAEIEAETEAAAARAKQMTLNDYLAASEATSSALNKPAETKQVEEIQGTEIAAKEQEVYFASTKVKTLKSKQLKTKQFLDFDASFSDNQKPKRSFDRNNNNNNNRRGGKGPRKGGNNAKKQNGNAVQKDKSIDIKNLPSLA